MFTGNKYIVINNFMKFMLFGAKDSLTAVLQRVLESLFWTLNTFKILFPAINWRATKGLTLRDINLFMTTAKTLSDQPEIFTLDC